MKFFSYFGETEIDQLFFHKPQNFNMFTRKELLSYALGATLYMPATRPNIHQDILLKKHKGLTSLVIDLEDAVGDMEVEAAESLLTDELLQLYEKKKIGLFSIDELPLLFIRVRHVEQLKRIREQLSEAIQLLAGVVLPKFEAKSGKDLIMEVMDISNEQHPFYAMPILESEKVMRKETRMEELMQIKQLLDQYRENILNVRIGTTDFSGLFGIRRNADTTVYDIVVLRDCIADIINVFQRSDHPYVISGPVWEYFSSKERMLKPQLRQTPFRQHYGEEGLMWRASLIDHNMDGFIREILMDIANGLIGKTIIHPSHIKIVNALNVISHEEFLDALNIMESATGEFGVRKSLFLNKMNEIKPHLYWAEKIILKSQIYGVLNEKYTSIDLIKKEVYI